VYPREFAHCLELLTRKLEQTATRWGIPDAECKDLEVTLAALPPVARSRTEALLNGIQLQAADDFPAMAFAAKFVLKLAHEIWDIEPVSIGATARALDEAPTIR